MCLLVSLPWKALAGGGWAISLFSVASTPHGPGTSGHSGCVAVKHLLVLISQVVLILGAFQEDWKGWGASDGVLKVSPKWPPRLLLSPEGFPQLNPKEPEEKVFSREHCLG